MQTGTEAIDRLHSTATSHNRVIVVELMGHRAGWLTLGAGIAGGADVILIPEIPYDVAKVAAAITARSQAGKHFSIVAVAEGAMSREQHEEVKALLKKREGAGKDERRAVSDKLVAFHQRHTDHTLQLTHQLEALTGQESRLTILGHLLRGGTPSAFDRVLSTRLGTAAAELVESEHFGVMAAVRGDAIAPVPLEEVAGKKKLVPLDHPWLGSARLVDTCFGD
jgi:6-phosphofructokinase 1